MEKYITKEEYRNAKGIDLDQELHGYDLPANKAPRFIKNVTDWCIDYLVQRYGAGILLSWPDAGNPTDEMLTEQRQTYFRLGVIEQIDYILQNGNLQQFAGFNDTIGTTANVSGIELSRSAWRKFWLAGFCNI